MVYKWNVFISSRLGFLFNSFNLCFGSAQAQVCKRIRNTEDVHTHPDLGVGVRGRRGVVGGRGGRRGGVRRGRVV